MREPRPHVVSFEGPSSCFYPKVESPTASPASPPWCVKRDPTADVSRTVCDADGSAVGCVDAALGFFRRDGRRERVAPATKLGSLQAGNRSDVFGGRYAGSPGMTPSRFKRAMILSATCRATAFRSSSDTSSIENTLVYLLYSGSAST